MELTKAELEAVVDQLPDIGEQAILLTTLEVWPLDASEEDLEDGPDELVAGSLVTVTEYTFGPPWKQCEIQLDGVDYGTETIDLWAAIGPEWRKRMEERAAYQNPNQQKFDLAAAPKGGTE